MSAESGREKLSPILSLNASAQADTGQYLSAPKLQKVAGKADRLTRYSTEQHSVSRLREPVPPRQCGLKQNRFVGSRRSCGRKSGKPIRAALRSDILVTLTGERGAVK